MTFERIGQNVPTPRLEKPNADGTKHGGTGSLMSPQNTSEIAKWLSRQSPADMDAAAVLRAQSHGVGLAVKTETRFPSGPNGERLPMYEVAVGCRVNGDIASRDAALADLKHFMTPAPVRQIEEWLAELSVLVAGRGPDDLSAELKLTAYSSRLAEYPADIVRQALLGRSWTWFPAWAELEKVCMAAVGPRRQMIAALSRPPEPKEGPRRIRTEDERLRIQQLIAEKFPSISADVRNQAIDDAIEEARMNEAPEAKSA